MSTVYYPDRSLSGSQSRSTSTPVPPQLQSMNGLPTNNLPPSKPIPNTLSPVFPQQLSFSVPPLCSPALDADLDFSDCSYDDDSPHSLLDVDLPPPPLRHDDHDHVDARMPKRSSTKSLQDLTRSTAKGRRSGKSKRSNPKRPRLAAKAQTVRVSTKSKRHKFFGNDQLHRPDDGRGTREGVQIRVRRRYKLDDGREGVVHFIGRTSFAKGVWVGLVLDAVGEGNCNGTVYGRKYFSCRDGRGLFVRSHKLLHRVGAYVHGENRRLSLLFIFNIV